MCEIGLKIVRYVLQCSEKLEILKSDEQNRKNKVLRMGSPGGRNVRTPRESVLALSRGSQLPYTKREKKISELGLPGGQNVPTPRESIFTLSRGSQLPYTKQIIKQIK